MIPGHRGLGGKAFSQSVSRHSSALAETLPPGSPLLKGCLITHGRFWRLKESCFQGHYTSVLPAQPHLPCVHLVLLRHETAKTNKGIYLRRTEGWGAHRAGRSGSLRQGVCAVCFALFAPLFVLLAQSSLTLGRFLPLRQISVQALL